MMELFWTPEAIPVRDEIYADIEANNPAAASTLDELCPHRRRRATRRGRRLSLPETIQR